jgi:hypothetical protein
MRAWGSSPVVGSSRKMIGGFPIRLIAMSRRRRMPPECVDSSVDRIFTTVVLPAPFEPSRAKMLPRSTSKSTPCSTCRSL